MKTCTCDKTESPATAEDVFFGRMNDPTAAATITGPCGDTMEVYLVVRDDVIREIKYHTDGCGNTRSCGHAIACRALGRNVTDALSISAGELIRSGECQPAEGRHCAILAVSTLYRAIADYLLAP
ncbi:MAG: iron-sulfur cluster assembly scaffold protein [Kiritimatiellae bacterium]|nr:iron-sulfur cluster assembly scaffold protein [Kiritimatiellia bacterium]